MQGYAEGWKNGEFVEKMDVQDCLQNPPYHKNDQGHFAGHFWHFHKEIDSKELHCLSFQGSSRIMRDYIETMAEKYETIMLDRAENLLHDWFGDVEYWSIRRSMRFAPDLVKIANEFRLNQLISDDEMDSTKMAKKWENHRVRKHSFTIF